MPDVKNSGTLDRILQRARTIGEKENAPLTSERFLIALFDAVETQGTAETELRRAERMLDDKGVKRSPAREVLAARLDKSEQPYYLQGLYMQKAMFKARAEAAEQGGREVTADLLLSCVLADPDEGVKVILADPEPRRIIVEDPGCGPTATVIVEEGAAQPETPVRPEEKKPAAPKEAMASLVADVKRIREELRESVYGQDNAVNVFTAGYFQASMLSMLDPSRKRPRATFLFAGPPGVGKTFLAEQAAQALRLPFMRFDMSEYSDKEANIEFCGSDKVYKNGKAGNVTSFVADNPRCVLLFDEIEKAHLNVIHLFLQMLDAGRLRDNYTDQEVSFSDTIIILTTNAGRRLYQESESGDFSSVSRKVIVKALQEDVNPTTGEPYFPGAICSRFAAGNVVMFNRMGAHDLRAIVKKEIRRHGENLRRETGIRLEIDEGVYTALLFAEGSSADARTVRSRAETFFNDELYELLRLIASEKVSTGVETVDEVRIALDLTGAREEVVRLFEPEGTTQVLAFAEEGTAALCAEAARDLAVTGVQTLSAAVEALKERDVAFVLLDMSCGAPAEAGDRLNVEDVESPARDFLHFLREHRADLPVYLLEGNGPALSEEEKVSFLRQGVRGVLPVGAESFPAELGEVAGRLHQQASMVKLARENKLVSFETAQSVSGDGRQAEIRLFDFRPATAVDAEDAKRVLNAVSRPDVRFEDVIGAGDAKKELAYFVEYLRDPKKYMGTGVKAPKGVLLYGPPGTGKTMLAKAMASEAGVTFLAAEGNQFLKKYVGEGSEQVHELFRTARKYAPSILFIDEIDAIAKERRGADGGNSGGEETLTAFLTEMDGFTSDPTKPVFVLAATNFDVEPGGSRSLDPALMRRFDRRVYIDLPGREDRIRFLRQKIARNKALDISEEEIENIAMRSTGMSLAELDSVLELALRSAIREGSTKVTDGVLEEAFETFNSGEVKKWDASQLERVARHEAGHAFLCWHGGETPSYLTIVARGSHGGYMQHADREGKAIYTKDELLARIRTSLGGRAAEIVYYGNKDGISTGASGDLASATAVAQRILCTYGMVESFGLAVVDAAAASGAMSPEIRGAVNRILEEQMAEAIRILSENREKVDALVEELLRKNHLSGAEIGRVLG